MASVLVDHVPHTTLQALFVAKDSILVRNDGHYVSDYEKDILGMAYPDLFPYGRRHPGTLRPVTMSFEEYRRYYMRLSGRIFAQHQTFGLIVFEKCAKRPVAKLDHGSGEMETRPVRADCNRVERGTCPGAGGTEDLERKCFGRANE